MAVPGGIGAQVVARFVDGRLLKGRVENFSPDNPAFHLYVAGENSTRGMPVKLSELKALFFVKTLEGNKDRKDDPSATGTPGLGRRISVAFNDGEILTGIASGYKPEKPGFFVVPADSACNNTRVFVVAKAVKRVVWVDAPRVPPTPATINRG